MWIHLLEAEMSPTSIQITRTIHVNSPQWNYFLPTVSGSVCRVQPLCWFSLSWCLFLFFALLFYFGNLYVSSTCPVRFPTLLVVSPHVSLAPPLAVHTFYFSPFCARSSFSAPLGKLQNNDKKILLIINNSNYVISFLVTWIPVLELNAYLRADLCYKIKQQLDKCWSYILVWQFEVKPLMSRALYLIKNLALFSGFSRQTVSSDLCSWALIIIYKFKCGSAVHPHVSKWWQKTNI